MALSVNASALLFNTMPGIPNYPFSLWGWFRVPNVSEQLELMGMLNMSGISQTAVFFEGNTTKSIVARSKNGTLIGDASTAPIAPNTWYHITTVFSSDTLRTVYLDGISAGVDTTSVPIAAMEFFYFGNIGSVTTVDIAEVAFADVAVDAEQAWSLAKGQPFFSSAVARSAKFYRDAIRDRNRPGFGLSLSSAASPVVTEHPRVTLSSSGVSTTMPLRYRGPWQVEQAELRPLSTDIAQLAIAGVGSNASILAGEVVS